jgi:integrase
MVAMAFLEKRTFTRHVDAQGRRVAKGTPGARKVQEKSAKWWGQYVDAGGVRRRVALCTDKTAARQMLADLERQAERGKAGLVDPHAEHRKSSIEEHVAAYEVSLRGKGVSEKHRAETIRRLNAVIFGCKVRTLGDLAVEEVERFLAILAEGDLESGKKGASARTRNTYRTSAKAFSKWCLKTRRLGEDVLASLEAVSGETRRQRRALTDKELVALLKVAKERPLKEALTIRRGKRKDELVANVRPEVRRELEQLGMERALMYKMMVLTGLRRGELESLEVRHLDLDGRRPSVILPGAFTKNGEPAVIPLMVDLVADLRDWLRTTGKTKLARVFRVPKELVKILKRDLKSAGIDYRDDRGRTIDVHALRHTTASYLARAKVSPRVAQEFMRHSDIKLTMQTYTDLRLLDENEALAALPEIPLSSGGEAKPESQAETACSSSMFQDRLVYRGSLVKSGPTSTIPCWHPGPSSGRLQ